VVRLTLRREHSGIANRELHAFVDRAQLHAPDEAEQRDEGDGQRKRGLDQRGTALPVAHEEHPNWLSGSEPLCGRIGTAFHQPR